MASVAGMSWEAAQRCFRLGYETYQMRGAASQSPWQAPHDKRCGLWTAGKDAARRRAGLERAWQVFLAREKAVL